MLNHLFPVLPLNHLFPVLPLTNSPNDRHIVRGRICFTTYHGSSRLTNFRRLTQNYIVLTTYDVLRLDFKASEERDTIYSHKWRRVVLNKGLWKQWTSEFCYLI